MQYYKQIVTNMMLLKSDNEPIEGIPSQLDHLSSQNGVNLSAFSEEL